MKNLFVVSFVLSFLVQTTVAQQRLMDCSCMATQSVLITNACQAVIPDMCQFTNCFFKNAAVPPQPLNCSQTPAAGTPVGPGSYPITVTVSDNNGLVEMCPLTFTVIPPQTGPFSLQCASDKTVDCNSQWSFDPPTPVNPCCPPAGAPNGGVTITVVGTTTNGVCPRVFTRTWQATDGCGHTATCKQTVTVTDTIPPSINIGQDETVSCGLGWGYSVPIVSDNCTPVQSLVVTAVSTTTNILCGQSFAGTRIWKVTDLCGNSTFATQVVTVVDFTPPVMVCGTNKSVVCGANWSFDAPMAYESCITGTGNSNVTVNVLNTVTNGLCPLVVTRTWTAVDGCGNSNQCSQTVTVGSSGGPALDCNKLAVLPILRTNACRAVIPDLCPFATAQAQQGCPCPVTCTQTPPAGTPVGAGPHPITVTLTDGSGNSVSCTVVFQVIASIQTRAWNTGMGGLNGNVSLAPGTTDPNYILVGWPTGGCSGPAQVQDPTTIPVPPWLGNGPDSQWIGPALNTINCGPGLYHYQLCFYLDCTDGATLTGQWSSDDWGTLHLNGQPTGYTIPSTQFPNNGFDILHPVSITKGFVCGMNCLDFYVTNAGTWTGLRAQFTNTFNDCCCKPQSAFSVFSGMNAAGPMPVASPDNQFSFTCNPPGVSYSTPLVVNPHPLWLPNGPNSQWIGPDAANQSVAGGVYCYTLKFDLPPCPSGVFKASLVGQWAADDSGTIYVNGNPTGNTLSSGWAFTNWQAINITNGLVPGLNTLTFYVTNLGNSSTGMRLELTGSTSCCDCTNICSVAIKCPTTVTQKVCGTKGIVAYAPPTATSSCGSAVTIVCTPPSGSVFPVGANSVICTATDAMGNSDTCKLGVIVVQDNTPPTIDCVCLQQQTRPIRACSAVIPDFCKYRDCYSDTCTANADLKCSQTPAAGTAVGPGTYVITVTVTDTDGNSSQCQVQFDVIAPIDTRVWHTGASGAQAANFVVVQTPSGPANIPSVLTTVPGAWLPNDATSKWVSFTGNSGNAAAGVYIYRMKFTLPCAKGASITGRFMSDDAARIYLNGVPTPALSTSFTTWAPVSLTSGFVPGVNTLDIYVTNAVIWTGIRVELTNSFNCCCPEALLIRCPTGQSGWVCGTATSAPVPYTVSAFSQCPSSNITVSVVCVPPSPGPFPSGTTIVNCTATDSLGNHATCSFPVKVVKDTIPPVITCPGPITIATCTNKVPAYYKATAKDDCSPTVTIVCVPPSGTLFNAGTTTTVTCTATDACGNKSSCSFPVKVLNNLVWQTLPAGIADCYSLAGSEPATPGACLFSAYPSVYWKPFDNAAVDRSVGHTWNFPVSWNILAANLSTRARPPVDGCTGNSGNDSIQLGLNNCATPSWLWARYFGSGNASPGLVESQWCYGSGCAFNFNLDLAALPPVSGPPINLLPHMNSVKRLDFFSQDDTTVDYADLRVLRCAPQSVFGGFEATMNNAKLVRGPIGNWCIIRDDINLPGWNASVTLGGAEAVALPMRYRCKPVEWDLKASTKARTAGGDEVVFATLTLSHQSNSPIAELRLTDIPPGVKEVQVLLLEDGNPVAWDTYPADPSLVLQTFSDTTEYHGVLFTREEGFFDVVRAEGEPGNQICVRFLPTPEAALFTSLDLEATGIDEFDVAEPQLRDKSKTDAVTLTGEGIGLAQDGQASISPLDPESSAPIGLRWRRPQGIGSQGQDGVTFMATNELTAYVQTVLKTTPPDTNRPRLTFTATGTFSDMSSRTMPGISFTGSVYGFGVSGFGDGSVQPIRRVQVWSNATLIVDVPNPATVECHTLPPIYRISRSPWYVDADICHRFPFYNRETVRINGQEYECSELRINLSSGAPAGESVEGIAGLDTEAAGVDALILSRVLAGPVPVRFHPPIRFSADDGTGQVVDRILIGWDQPWPALEAAPSVLGPWIQLPTDGTEITVPANGVSTQFYRLRE